MIKSYDKMISVLDYVQTHPHVKLQVMADGLGMSKSTLHRIVTELVDQSFLSRDEDHRTYRLGMRLLDYGHSVLESFDIRSDSADIINELNRVTLETVHLAVMVDNRVVYADKRESTHTLRMYSLVGKEAPVHCTGVGKAILAFQDADVVDKLILVNGMKRYTEHTLTRIEDLKEELAVIRSEGIAYDREEHEKGIICIAAPVINHDRKIRASISITSITQRMTLSQLLEFKNLLIKAAADISRRIGYRGE